MDIPELGFAIDIGGNHPDEIARTVNSSPARRRSRRSSRGYGLGFCMTERKAISMGWLTGALALEGVGEDNLGATRADEEFVLYTPTIFRRRVFLEAIKRPHYVDFQSATGCPQATP